MNASEIFDQLLALFMFGCFLIILVSLAHIVDAFLSPPECNCAELRRQERETRGVVL